MDQLDAKTNLWYKIARQNQYRNHTKSGNFERQARAEPQAMQQTQQKGQPGANTYGNAYGNAYSNKRVRFASNSPNNNTNYTPNNRYPRATQRAIEPPPASGQARAYHVTHGAEEDQFEIPGQLEESTDSAELAEVYFNNSAEHWRSFPPFHCGRCRRDLGNSEDLRQHCIDWHGEDIRSGFNTHRIRRANEIEACNNVYVIPAPTSRGYLALEGAALDGTPLPICVDTGSGATFVDEALIPHSVTPIHAHRPIAVKGIHSTQILYLFCALNISLPDGKTMPIKAWILKGLRAGLLLGMTTMKELGIQLDIVNDVLTYEGNAYDLTYTTPVDAFHISIENDITIPADSATSFHAAVYEHVGIQGSKNVFGVRGTQIGAISPRHSPETRALECRVCNQHFDSKNRLFEHIRHVQHTRPATTDTARASKPLSGRRRHLGMPWRSGMA
ncbi:MAG: hypothetical protein AVDCRST_MAG95-497 [uncultured Adhaeribacter sp.]|uniref:C2H2-type domain-containing protein n=1 Tax=uncultured Adhaeribacter sp. TaxID=448109 RepID=A0A6J4HB84_9BACT|nr:MAG: hypothetical protein AVDCRST_MAG95-497 [uncultured Adhaeribacter sp.]